MVITKKQVKKLLPLRHSYQNKGDFGHVLVIGGSVGMSGSVCMTANSALRSGAGLVTVAVPSEISDIVSSKLTECIVLPIKSENGVISETAVADIEELLPKADIVAIGMGGRICNGLKAVLEFVLSNFHGKVIIDADGLNIISQNKQLLDIERKCEIILTPHPKEMARLCDMSIDKVQTSRQETAITLAKKYNVSVLLKGESTIITDGNDIYLNPTGNQGMATAGAGDVLSGVISGLSAQGVNVLQSGVSAAYIHGLAGDLGAFDKTCYSLTACDIIEYLPSAFKEILK